MTGLPRQFRIHRYYGVAPDHLAEVAVGSDRSLLHQLRALFADHARALRATALADASRHATPVLRTLYTTGSDDSSPKAGKSRQVLPGARPPRAAGNIAHP